MKNFFLSWNNTTMLEALEALSGLFIAFLLLSIPIAIFFIWIGAKIAGIKNTTFRRVGISAIVASAITHILTLVFYALPHFITMIGFIIGLTLALFAIKSIFHSTFGQAFLVWIFNIMAQISAVIIGAILFVGGIKDFIKII